MITLKRLLTVLSAGILVSGLISCSKTDVISHKLSVQNPLDGSMLPQLISIAPEDLPDGSQNSVFVKGVPSEWGLDEQGNPLLNALVSLSPGESLTLDLVSVPIVFDDRVQAELSVRQKGQWDGSTYKAESFAFQNVDDFTSPPQLTDHSYYLRYEGPGWENDLIGYRLYLDWRNAIDVFAKTGEELALHQAGQDGYDSYHKLASWGGDALKVGKSLGVGALGRLSEGVVQHFKQVDKTVWRLIYDNKLSAAFDVQYSNWVVNNKGVDVTTRYTISAGDPATHINAHFSSPIEDLVIGLVKHAHTEIINKRIGEWSVVATFGEQSVLAEGDKLGLAIFYRQSQVKRVFEGEFDHLVQFKPLMDVEYAIMAVWPEHPESPDSLNGFEALLDSKLHALSHPYKLATLK